MKNLGTKIANIAQPIAKTIDKTANILGIESNIQGCKKCKQMEKNLNDGMSFMDALVERVSSMKKAKEKGEIKNMQYTVTKTIIESVTYFIEGDNINTPSDAKAAAKRGEGIEINSNSDERYAVIPKGVGTISPPTLSN